MISVVIPIYNVEKYLNKCLDSVKNQTFQDFEVIMIDDGSTDNSGQIAKNYLDDKRFNYQYKDNAGQGSARNIGIDMAKGEYICFIDSDDYVESNYLEELYFTLINNNSDISQCSVNRVWEDGVKQLYRYTGNTNELFTDIRSYLKSCSFVMWNKLFRKELFKDLRFPEYIKYEDFALAPQVYCRARLIASTDKRLYNYRCRNNSTTTGNQFQLDILKAQSIIEESIFGKENFDIIQSYFVRQVMASLLWSMSKNSNNINDMKKIMLDGLRKYPDMAKSINDAKISKYKKFWCILMINKHFNIATLYVRLFMVFYPILHFINRMIK